jgi:hypothetical protein
LEQIAEREDRSRLIQYSLLLSFKFILSKSATLAKRLQLT